MLKRKARDTFTEWKCKLCGKIEKIQILICKKFDRKTNRDSYVESQNTIPKKSIKKHCYFLKNVI